MKFAHMVDGVVAQIIGPGDRAVIADRDVPYRYMVAWQKHASTQGVELSKRGLVLIGSEPAPATTSTQVARRVRCRVGDAAAVDRWEVVDVPTAADDVRREAGRRIEARYPIHRQLNVIRTGGDALAEMSAFIDAVRLASNALEAAPPADYRADEHWP